MGNSQGQEKVSMSPTITQDQKQVENSTRQETDSYIFVENINTQLLSIIYYIDRYISEKNPELIGGKYLYDLTNIYKKLRCIFKNYEYSETNFNNKLIEFMSKKYNNTDENNFEIYLTDKTIHLVCDNKIKIKSERKRNKHKRQNKKKKLKYIINTKLSHILN
jgi:hypothetical protein